MNIIKKVFKNLDSCGIIKLINCKSEYSGIFNKDVLPALNLNFTIGGACPCL